MGNQAVLLLGLIFATLFTMAAAMLIMFRIKAPSARPPSWPPGVLVKLACPHGETPVTVGLRANPVTSGLSVAWCERFPDGVPECDRACISPLAPARRDEFVAAPA